MTGALPKPTEDPRMMIKLCIHATMAKKQYSHYNNGIV
jgi:transposase